MMCASHLPMAHPGRRQQRWLPCRIEFPAPPAAPDGAESSIRTLKQGDGEKPRHYWDSAQGTDLAAEAPSLDWGVPQSGAVRASSVAMPAGRPPKPAPHYWDRRRVLTWPLKPPPWTGGPLRAAPFTPAL